MLKTRYLLLSLSIVTLTLASYLTRFSTAVILLFLPIFLKAQQAVCATENEPADCGAITQLNTTGPYYIRIYVNVIRDGNGNGGQTSEQVHEAINFLHQDFKNHNIFFIWENCHINYINNQAYYEAVAGDEDVLSISQV